VDTGVDAGWTIIRAYKQVGGVSSMHSVVV
jgi:hypothetical protein